MNYNEKAGYKGSELTLISKLTEEIFRAMIKRNLEVKKETIEIMMNRKWWEDSGANLKSRFNFLRYEIENLSYYPSPFVLEPFFQCAEIGRAVQQECRDRSRMPSSA
eukprot:TRINITY_DN32004_c0_g1_i1.p1 TRINITY_DN32004_c0_g1~~TRINITY_DN32004_c0_g1_i1.p1  ORF type:complete len:107 (-),score=20.47 TRINITY_DN32004_c0_g1_i1:10-330(-)